MQQHNTHRELLFCSVSNSFDALKQIFLRIFMYFLLSYIPIIGVLLFRVIITFI